MSCFNDGIPDTVIDLTVEKKSFNSTGISGSFSITLYDDTALYIESLIASNYSTDNACHIQYGWAGSGGRIINSCSFIGMINQYSLSFNGPTITLDISGLPQSLARLALNYNLKTYKGNKSDIVAQICNEMGVPIGRIEPTIEEENNVYRMTNENYLSFIMELSRTAESAESGSIGYTFYTDFNKAYFVPIDDGRVVDINQEIVNGVQHSNLERIASGATRGVQRYYEYYSGSDANTVISFSPSFTPIHIDAAPTKAMSINYTANEMMQVIADGGSRQTGNSVSDKAETSRIMGISSDSIKNLSALNAKMWEQLGTQVVTADLEILGDPEIFLYEGNIYLAVYTKYGFMHHTSGMYKVLSATDSISSGNFTSTLGISKLEAGSPGYTGWIPGVDLNDSNLSDAIEELEINNVTNTNTSTFIWPVVGNVVTEYGTGINGKMYRGMRFSCDVGTSVLSMDNGVVVKVGNDNKYGGNYVAIKHEDTGYVAIYGGLDSIEGIFEGLYIAQGGQVGEASNNLYIQVNKNGFDDNTSVNPRDYLT